MYCKTIFWPFPIEPSILWVHRFFRSIYSLVWWPPKSPPSHKSSVPSWPRTPTVGRGKSLYSWTISSHCSPSTHCCGSSSVPRLWAWIWFRLSIGLLVGCPPFAIDWCRSGFRGTSGCSWLWSHASKLSSREKCPHRAILGSLGWWWSTAFWRWCHQIFWSIRSLCGDCSPVLTLSKQLSWLLSLPKGWVICLWMHWSPWRSPWSSRGWSLPCCWVPPGRKGILCESLALSWI